MISDFLDRTGKTGKASIALLLILIVGSVDYYTTNEISFSIFYLIPISFAGWFLGKKIGIVFAVIGALTWFLIDFLYSAGYSSPAIPFWNTLVRFGFFIIVVILISKIKTLQVSLEGSVKQRTSELVKEINDHKKSKEEITQKTDQLRELNKKVESIKEEQNARIAREIHDELGQLLTAINLEVNWIGKKYAKNEDIAGRTSLLSAIISDTIATVRKISSDLRPRLLDQLGLFSAVESLVHDFERRSAIKTSLVLPKENIYIDGSSSTTIFRILQEALTNIARHSNANNVDVKLWLENSSLMMSVKDDGIGFDSSTVDKGTKSLGIIGMKERANILHGSLEINSFPGKGTEIILTTHI